MKDARVESARSEPTVFGAVRRYRIMVLAFALAGMVAAVGYTVYMGKSYQAKAQVTVPIPESQLGQNPAQYLDSQVLLLESPAVAQKAASIADATLQGNTLSARDFSPSNGSVSITPPAGAAVGGYGASIIGVTFTASSPTTAQTGANALLQAFEDVRSASIAAEYQNAIARIDNTINETTNQAQLAALQAQRTQQLVNEQIDLAQQPTVAWAVEPARPASGSWKRAAPLGLVIGLVLGAAAAYVRASLRRGFVDRQDPAALYGVPLIGEIPAFEAGKMLRSNAAGRRAVSADERRSSVRRSRSVPFRSWIRRTDPRRTGAATVAGLRLAPRVCRQEHGHCQPGSCHRRRRHPRAGRGRQCGRWGPDRSATARYPDGPRLGAGAGWRATAGELHPAQPAQRRGGRPRVGSGLTAAGDGCGPLESSFCVDHHGEVKLRCRADRQPSLASGRRRYRVGQRLRRCDYRPQLQRAGPRPPRDGGPAQAHRGRRRRLYLQPSADATPTCPLPAQRFIGSPNGRPRLQSFQLLPAGHWTAEAVRPLNSTHG